MNSLANLLNLPSLTELESDELAAYETEIREVGGMSEITSALVEATRCVDGWVDSQSVFMALDGASRMPDRGSHARSAVRCGIARCGHGPSRVEAAHMGGLTA